MKETIQSPFSERLLKALGDKPNLSHATVRVAVWLGSLQERLGVPTVELHKVNFLTGYYQEQGRNRYLLQHGIAFRPPTLTAAINNLVEENMLIVGPSDKRGQSGFFANSYTLVV